MENENLLPKYEQIKLQIKKAIIEGEFTDKLPGERILAEKFNVSYMTMRKAIEDLTEEEILYKEPGRGTFVCKKGHIYKKTYNIGFFLPEWIGGGITGHYYSTLFNQIERNVHNHGYNLLYFSKIKDIFPYSDKRKVDGILFTLFPEEEEYLRSISNFINCVTLENILEYSNIPAVIPDNFGGGYEATKYLIKLGHKNIAYITGRFNNKLTFERYNGYKKALEEYDIKVPENYVIEGDFLFDTGFKLTNNVLSLSPLPTAVVTGNDLMALGLMKGLQLNGIKVPNDISIVGFDDIDAASQSHPTLTTMHVYHDKIAEIATNILFKMINNEYEHQKQEVIIVPVSLVERDSTKKI